MRVLRTPDDRFSDLPGFPYAPSYATTSDGQLSGTQGQPHTPTTGAGHCPRQARLADRPGTTAPLAQA